MSKKFIPNSDVEFGTMASCFARVLAKDAGLYFIPQAEADELQAAQERYEAARMASRSGERSMAKTRLKDEARDVVEQIIRRMAHVIRANPKIDAIAKIKLGLRERVARAKVLSCPQEPPRLQFVRALHEGSGATPMHELSFSALDFKSKPAGAVRMELFVDLVPLEEEIPQHPAANLASRPWYLRSYTRSPIRLVPPLARVPMRVVYWGRWADSSGQVGPFSKTTVAWVEGGLHKMLTPAIGWNNKPVPVMELPAPPGGADRDPAYSVAVMEAQYESMRPGEVPMLETLDAEIRQLQGPNESEAA